jgi:hypothetical protein
MNKIWCNCVNKIQTGRIIHYFHSENIALSQWKSMECPDEAASSVATGRASVAGKTAVDGVVPSAANQAAAPTLWKGVTISLHSYILIVAHLQYI